MSSVLIEPSPLGSSAEHFFQRMVDDVSPTSKSRFVATLSSSWDLMDDAPDAAAPPEARTRGPRAAAAVVVVVALVLALGGAAARATAPRPAPPPRPGPEAGRGLVAARAAPPPAPPPRFEEAVVTLEVRLDRRTEARVAAAAGLGGLAFLFGVPFVPGLVDNAILGVLATLAPILSLGETDAPAAIAS